MATIVPTVLPGADIKHQRVSWEGFAASGDVGTAVTVLGPYPDKTVQVFGTFAGAAAITWEGSLDGGATYFTLTDVNNVALVLSAAAGKAVTEAVPLIRPRMTAGAAADVDCWLFASGVSL